MSLLPLHEVLNVRGVHVNDKGKLLENFLASLHLKQTTLAFRYSGFVNFVSGDYLIDNQIQ